MCRLFDDCVYMFVRICPDVRACMCSIVSKQFVLHIDCFLMDLYIYAGKRLLSALCVCVREREREREEVGGGGCRSEREREREIGRGGGGGGGGGRERE